MKITCCSHVRYDPLRFCGIEVQGLWQDDSILHDDGKQMEVLKEPVQCEQTLEFQSSDISQALLNQTMFSVLSVNELLVCNVGNVAIVCRLSGCLLDEATTLENNKKNAVNAAMEEPFRGRGMLLL